MKNTLLIIFTCLNFSIFAQSTIVWSPAMDVSTSTYDNMHPRVVTDRSGNPLVIWGRASDESVFFSKWNGTGFTMPMKVNAAGLTVATASWMGPDIASKGDTVYVVMKETPEVDTAKHIFISRSVNGGVTFGAPMRVEYILDSISRFPTVTTDALGNPIVGFMKLDPSFGSARWTVAKSTNFGNSFSPDVKASGWSGMGALVCDCCPGSITCSGNKVAMIYRDNLSNIRDMWAGISSNLGTSFTQGLGYDEGNWLLMYCPSSGPDGTIIGDTLYTTYMSGASGDELVYTNASSLSALTNSPGIPITGQFIGLTQQNFPRMASSVNAIATVYRQSVSGIDYLISRFSNNVATGMYDLDTVASGGVMNADVTMLDGKIFTVWQDYSTGTVKYRMGTYASVTSVLSMEANRSVLIYPNPFSSKISVATQNSFGGNATLSIQNMLGEVVYKKDMESFSKTNNIDLAFLPKGIYLLSIMNGENKAVRKIVKQ